MIVTYAAKAGGTMGAQGQMGTNVAKRSLKASPEEVPREQAWREPASCRDAHGSEHGLCLCLPGFGSWWQLASCVMMGKLLNPSEPSFLERENNDGTYLAVLGRFNDTALVTLRGSAQSVVGTRWVLAIAIILTSREWVGCVWGRWRS